MVEAGASKKKGQLRLRNAGEQGDLRALPAVLCVQVVPSFTSAHCIHRPVNNTKSSADVKKNSTLCCQKHF